MRKKRQADIVRNLELKENQDQLDNVKITTVQPGLTHLNYLEQIKEPKHLKLLLVVQSNLLFGNLVI